MSRTRSPVLAMAPASLPSTSRHAAVRVAVRAPAALGVAALVGAAGLPAQESPAELPAASAGRSVVRTRGNASERWRLRDPWSVAAEVPVGLFHLRGQVDVTSFVGRFPDRPTLDVQSGLVELGARRGLPGGFAVGAGTAVGLFRLADRDEVFTGAESEILLGLRAELLSPPWRGWRLGMTGDVQRVLYREPLDLPAASLRLRRALPVGEGVAAALSGPGAAGDRDTEAPEGPVSRGPPPGAHRTLTAGELAVAGVRTPEHLLELLEGWAISTPNGATTSLSAPGGLPFGDVHWRVIVDGLEVPVGALGSAAVDRLPFVLEEVDSIRVHDGPGLLLGRSTDRGALEIFTRSPEGPALRASGGIENSRGEPGLLAVRGDATPNIDHLGTSVRVWAGIGGASGGAAYSVFDQRRTVTDPPIRARVWRASPPSTVFPQLRGRHHAGRAELGVGDSRHVVRISRTSGTDYLYLPPLGGEVVTGNRLWWGGVRGGGSLGADASFGYRGSLGHRTLEPLEADPGPGLGFRERVLSAGAHLRRGPWRLEVEGRRRKAVGRSDLTDEAVGTGRVRLTRRVRGLQLSGSAGRGSGATIFDLLAAWSGALGASTGLRASALAARVTGDRPGSLWSWVERGYGFLDQTGIDVEARGDPGPGSRVVADVRLHHRTGELGAVEGGLSARRETGLTVPLESVAVRDGLPVPARTIRLRRSVGGARVSARAGARGARGSVRGSVRVDWTVASWGDRAWDRAWGAVPSTRARAALTWWPAPDLSLRYGLRYRSRTRWEGFDVEGSEVDGTVPAAWVVSVTGRKTLWEGRLAGTLRLDDLLDADRPTHPFGESPGTRLSLEGRLRL